MGKDPETFDTRFVCFFDELDSMGECPILDNLKSVKTRYEDFEYQDEGGLKVIEVCEDLKTGRQVAMASLKSTANDQQKEAFLKEARITASLQHPNIVPLYDIGLTADKPWFTMKFIIGASLEKNITDLKHHKTSLLTNLSDRLDMFVKVCDAVAYAHSKGIIHLDIKPANIQISEYGDVLLCDWGLAKILDLECDESFFKSGVANPKEANTTIDGYVKGSPGFMAPEQTNLLNVQKGFHTDIFSLGCVLYNILTFEAPFQGKDVEAIMAKTAAGQFTKPTELNHTIPLSLEAVCLKAMAVNPEDRYETVLKLQSDILNYRNGFATNAEEASTYKLVSLWIKRNKVVSLSCLIIIFMGIYATWSSIHNLKLENTNARQLAEKVQLEKEFHVKFNKDAAPRFFARAQEAFNAFNFDDAMNFCDSAIELNPDLKEAWKLKGTLHLIYEQFHQANKAFKNVKGKSQLKEIAKKYSRLKPIDPQPLPLNLSVEFFKSLIREKQKQAVAAYIHHKAYSKLSIDERLAYCQKLLLAHNHKYVQKIDQNIHINFHYNQQTKHLDLSNNPWLHTALILQNFPAKSIDMSKTSINSFICFRNQPLISLDVSHTKILELNTLTNKNLQNLNIAHTSISDLSKLRELSLESMNISHSAVRSTGVLVDLKTLKKLYIHQGQYDLQKLQKLLPQTKIIIL